MKTKLKLLITALCGIFVTTAAFGQLTQIWNGAGDGTNFDQAANWGGTLPSTATPDFAEFNGVVSGALNLNYSAPGNFQSGYNSSGLNIILTPSQIGSVSIDDLAANRGSVDSPNLAIYNLTNNSPTAAFALGSDTAVLNIAGRPAGAVHVWQNNSSATATMGSGLHFIAGGGNAFTYDFNGTGNWLVKTYLVTDNTPNNNTTVQVDGPGMMIWNPTLNAKNSYANSIAAINITGGTLDLIAPHPKLSNQAITDNGTFAFSAPSLAQGLSGVISGAGSLVVSNGTLTLSGASTFTGTTILDGGELIVDSAENLGVSGPLGVGGFIVFNGGTLGFSSANTYDYSPRFTNSASQAFSFDTAGQTVTFTNSIVSSGGTLTKLGAGSLTLSGANTYDGATTVSAGTLEIQGAQGSGAINMAGSTTLGVTETGPQITPATLTVGSSAFLEFNNVSSQTTAPLAVTGAVSASGPITVNVASGSFNIGHSYPLFSWGSGNPPPVVLGTVVGAVGNLTTNGSTIQLNVTGLAYVWSGLNNANWDTSTANNWKVNGVAQIWTDGSAALFDDTVTTANTNIILNSTVQPASTTVNSATTPYFFSPTGGNVIGGTGGFTKNGAAMITMFFGVFGGANTYSGPTTLNGGTVVIGDIENGGVASDIGASSSSAANLVLNGGTLQFFGLSGSGTSDRLFTLGTAGGTIDNEGGTALTLNNPGSIALSGSGARTLVLADGVQVGSTPAVDTLAAVLGDNGGKTAITKNGAGTWILTGNSTNSGTVTINAGLLQVGAGGSASLGTGAVVDNGSLDFNIVGTLTNGAVSGSGSVTKDGPGTVILSGNNTYLGSTTINAGALQIGNGGASGISGNSSITDSGTFIINTPSLITLEGYNITLNGTGNLILRSGSFFKTTGGTYTGWTQIDPGATLQPSDGNSGQLATPLITNNGTLFMTRQDNSVFYYSGTIVGSGKVVKDNNNANAGDVTLNGVGSSYTGGTWIGGGGIILGDGTNSGTGWLPAVGPVVFTNTTSASLNIRYLFFNMVGNYTVTNNIIGAVTDGSSTGASGEVAQLGTNTLTLIGNNTYPGGTIISNGILQVGNGGTIGSIGSGSVNDSYALVFNRSDSVIFSNTISGPSTAMLANSGPGAVTLAGDASAFTGNLMVSNGTMVVNGTNAAAYVEVLAGGTLRGTGGSCNLRQHAGGCGRHAGGRCFKQFNWNAHGSHSCPLWEYCHQVE